MNRPPAVSRHRDRASVVLFFFCLTLGLAAQPTNVSILPPPAWVSLAEWKTPAPGATNSTSEGTHYLLYERQKNPGLKESFAHAVVLMQNETGVQDSGNLSFEFDPSYQELILHHVRIHRNGQVLPRLDKSKIRMIQPESQLNGHVFTGEQTAVLFVEDLRVGDVLDYASTTRGANPVLDGHFSTRLLVQSGVPVDRQRLRVVWSPTRPLHLRQHLTPAPPVKSTRPEGTEYVWDFTNLTAIAHEDFTPVAFEPYPYVELSDFDNWARVVEWALPLYNLAETNFPPELQKLMDQWQRSATSDEERARMALQFVQDELRYTGLELGPDSYRPAHPFETFERRFGDCKGKVSLLCAILRAMKLEAWPALVHTSAREAIALRLPSPFAFNHVIVKLHLAGRTLWLDPTISHQGGLLGQRYVSPLGKALVVQTGGTSLEDIPPQPKGGTIQHVVSTFNIINYESPVPLTVKTTYRGFGADDMREQFARTDSRDLSKDYLNFYARYYPGIHAQAPMEVSDNRPQNIFTITEHYQITNLWKLDDSSNRWEAFFHADSLVYMLPEPATRLRQRPLRMPFPVRRAQEIVVHLPDKEWKIPTLTEEVQHEAFVFHHRRQLSGSELHFNYDCETKVPEIPPGQVASYLAKRDQAENLMGDTLQRPRQATGSVLAQLNWLMVVIAVFGAAATGIGCFWAWRLTPAALPPLHPEDQKYAGLGGWLILIGIGLCFAPVTRVSLLAKHWEGLFSLNAWQMVAMPTGEHYHPLYAPLLIFEVLGNVLLLGINLLALGLFFKKRSLFPKVWMILMFSNAAFLWADGAVSGMIPFVSGSSGGSTWRKAFSASWGALLWTAYLFKSKRVRATFRDGRNQSDSPPVFPVN